VFASKAYFQAIGLCTVYRKVAGPVLRLSGMGTTVTPLMVSLLLVAILLAGGRMLLQAGLKFE
jgi:hypothetical protein